MAVEWRDASDEIGPIAEKLIEEVEVHRRLEDAPVRFVFRSEAQRSKGRLVLGRAHVVTGLRAFLAGPVTAGDRLGYLPFFVVEIAEDVWERMTDRQRVALVDHELSHCEWDEVLGKGTLRPHTIEEFLGVLERHGPWQRSLAEMLERVPAGQLTLEGADPFMWTGETDPDD